MIWNDITNRYQPEMNKNLDRKSFGIFWENAILWFSQFVIWNNNISWFFQYLQLILWQIKIKQMFWYYCNISEAIWGCLSQGCSNRKGIIFPMSFLWSSIILNPWVSLHTTHSQTFHLYTELRNILMYQGKIWRADLNLRISSYD